MYSVVLMMAMTTGGDVPDGILHHGGCGGHSCSGYAAPACGCSGHAAPAYSCTGGSCHGGHHFLGGGLFHHRGHSCHGGCSGVVYAGCTGSMGYSCTGGSSGCTGGTMAPPAGKPGEELKKMPKEEDKKKTGMAPAPATLIVSLPADAKLIIDDTTTTSTSTERVFVSPTLTPGTDYNYTLKAEVVRNGKTVKVEEKVVVRAGQETRVTLLATDVAAR
jgi:uncharacterized protein (TIGR03000 family)